MKSDYDRDRRGEKNRREYRGERQTGVSKPQTRGREDSYKDSYNGNRMRGAGRRIYPADGNAPRVGRIAENVPQAVRVTGDVSLYPSKPKKAVNQDVGMRNGKKHGFTAKNDFQPDSRTFRQPGGARPLAKSHFQPAFEAPENSGEPLAEFENADFESENMLVGRNPIREALRAGRPMEKLLVATGDLSGAARDIVKLAKESNVVVQYVDRTRLDQIYPAHQGMLAYVAAVPYVQLEDILAAARTKGEDPFIVILDGITDPHNLGAIIRSAECAGAHGVILPERRAAGLGPAAAKAAAGALNHMPVARVKNLNRAIEELQAANVWVIGTAMDGEDALKADLSGPVALVIGSEGDGISRLTLEKCDRRITLPMKGRIESLNASVAAGVLMYEVVRARAK